jgi:hypothetical protein
MMKILSPKEVVAHHGKLLGEIQKVVQRSRGDLTYFDERTFVLSWNATAHVRRHASEACLAAFSIKKFSVHLLEETGLQVKIGAAVGDSYCGTIGTHTKRQFCLFSKYRGLAEELCKLNSYIGTDFLVNENMCMLVAKDFELRPISRLSISDDNGFYADTAYEIILPKKKHTDSEWMYEMDASLEKYEAFFKSFSALSVGDVDMALGVLQEYEQTQGADQVTLNLIASYTQMIEQNKKAVHIELSNSQWTTEFSD